MPIKKMMKKSSTKKNQPTNESRHACRMCCILLMMMHCYLERWYVMLVRKYSYRRKVGWRVCFDCCCCCASTCEETHFLPSSRSFRNATSTTVANRKMIQVVPLTSPRPPQSLVSIFYDRKKKNTIEEGGLEE
jgi:hypothetical protein